MLTWNQFDRSHKVFVWMTAIFLTCLVIANITGSMLFSFQVPFLPEPVLLSAGIIPFPVTFILTDLLNEFYGKQGARFVTYVGFGMSVLVYLLLLVGEQLPVDPISQITRPQFLHLSQLYTGMFIASLTAYGVGQLLDIQIFHIFRAITRHRFIWLRATGSTVISQLFDSLLVTFIAFWGAHSPETLWKLALGNYTWKFLIAVGITPLLYLGHGLLSWLLPRQEQALEAVEPEYKDDTA
jgi:uncharacterized integral membrane protein (TIGR00697 family)